MGQVYGDVMDLILTDRGMHALEICKVVNAKFSAKDDVCIARVKDGHLLGGVIFQQYTGSSIELHMAAMDSSWLSRDYIWAVFAYPFLQLKCRKVFARIKETNERTLAIARRIGFKLEAKLDDAYPDGALMLLSLRPEDCRWLQYTPRRRFWELQNEQ